MFVLCVLYDPDLTARTQASADIAVSSLKTMHPSIWTPMEMQADVTNMPRIGSLDNAFFPTMQLNIVAARKEDDVQSKSTLSTLLQCTYTCLLS